MNKFSLWDLKAILYKLFRHRFPFSMMLNQENEALHAFINRISNTYSTVLDLGTGDGNSLKCFSASVKKIGVDFNLSMLTNASHTVNALFINSEIISLALKKNIADLVLIIGVLEYYSELEPFFREIHRISKNNAHVILSYAPNNLWTFLRRFLGQKIYPTKLEKLLLLIDNNGFQFIDRRSLFMQHQLLIRKKLDN